MHWGTLNLGPRPPQRAGLHMDSLPVSSASASLSAAVWVVCNSPGGFHCPPHPGTRDTYQGCFTCVSWKFRPGLQLFLISIPTHGTAPSLQRNGSVKRTEIIFCLGKHQRNSKAMSPSPLCLSGNLAAVSGWAPPLQVQRGLGII